MSPRRWSSLAPLAAALLIVLLETPLLFPSPAVGDNFQFWAAGHMVVTGLSPYDRASWVDAAAYGPTPGDVAVNTVPINLAITQQVWLYPPQTAFLFAPFGAMPLEIGIPLLHLATLVVTFAGVATVAWMVGLRGPRLAFALTLAVVSQPFVIATRNGHPIGLLLIGGALAVWGVQSRRDLAAAIGIALLTLKPQIAVPLIAFAFGLALVRRDLRRLAVLTVSALVVTGLPWLVTPFPLDAVAASSGERLDVDLSSVAALARDLGDGAALTAILTAVVAIACAAAVAARRGDPALTVAAVLFILSLALMPYVHDYDMLMLAPAAFVLLTYADRERHGTVMSMLAAIALVLAPWFLFYWWPIVGAPTRRFLGGPLGAAPLAIAITLAIGAYLSRDALARGAPRHTPESPQRDMA